MENYYINLSGDRKLSPWPSAGNECLSAFKARYTFGFGAKWLSPFIFKVFSRGWDSALTEDLRRNDAAN